MIFNHIHSHSNALRVLVFVLLMTIAIFAQPVRVVNGNQTLTFNYNFDRTLGRFDTVSSPTYYGAVQSSNIKVDALFVSCAAKITGPYWATFRIYVQALQQSVQMYFEYWRVAANWEGTADGTVDFTANSWTARVSPPAAESTSISVDFQQNTGSTNSGQLDTQIQLWAEVIPPTQVSFSQCSWQLEFEGTTQSIAETLKPTTTVSNIQTTIEQIVFNVHFSIIEISAVGIGLSVISWAILKFVWKRKAEHT